jgi:hypothetical protein
MWHIGVPPSVTGSTQTGISQGTWIISPVSSSGMNWLRVSMRAGLAPISGIETTVLPASGPRRADSMIGLALRSVR